MVNTLVLLDYSFYVPVQFAITNQNLEEKKVKISVPSPLTNLKELKNR